MALSKSVLDEIRAKTTLSAVVKETTTLQRAGREWKACCPFHEEDTPSFYVNDEKHFYHCFGCGAHGDAIRWLTDKCGMTFREAVEKLAYQTSVKLPEEEMMSKSIRSRGGAKLNRTETVTIRLDPKLNYLCELASRAQRRTKSSFIEWAVLNSLGDVTLPDVHVHDYETGATRQATLSEKANELWQVDEPDRVIGLALFAPSLLNHDEQLVWRLVKENGYLWRGNYNLRGEWSWEAKPESLIIDRLRENWELFKLIASGERHESELPRWVKVRADDDLDDIPF
ncbi:MAG: hypothetical protein B7Z08_01625 [Sphingomonadales bacterium 32-68-7]|nr:MAG: hypothetical protein B7Z33_00465 [Sphingomonadales bacterium 12-68-11]OYX10279.1 MAG: hypothetical protein B7Z08_01625 [Sphingomonadales bacterium 32-68-7]